MQVSDLLAITSILSSLQCDLSVGMILN